MAGTVIRLVHWWTVRDQPFFAQLIMDSQEYDRWALEILHGDRLGTELFFQAPLYPYLLALLYTLFGHSYDAVYLFQIAFGAFGTYGLYRAGRTLESESLGLAAAALLAGFAVLPFYDVQLLKESLAVSTVGLLLWALAVARGGSRRAGPWIVAGLLIGVLTLLRENTLLMLPLFALLALEPSGTWKRLALVRAGRRTALLFAGVALALTPVAIRNFVVGGVPLPTTFQGGTNFYIGNNPEADGTYRPIVPGKQIPVYERREPIRVASEALGRSLTPAEASSYWLERSLRWARQEPAAFLDLQRRKLAMYWRWYEWPDAVDYYFVRRISPVLVALPFELGSLVILACAGLWTLRRRLFTSFLPVTLFILGWTGSTVIFFIFSRYRLPMVPALALLAAVPVAALFRRLAAGDRRRAIGGAALLAAAILLPRAVMPEPRMGLVRYNLGVIHQQAGRLGEAEAQFREALRVSPDHFLAAMGLGRIAAQRRDWQSARGWFLEARRMQPESDDVQLNLGAVHMALGRPAEAKAHLERALELNRNSPGILHNLSLAEHALWQQGAGSLEEALRLNREVLETAPGYPPALALRDRLETEGRPHLPESPP